MKHSVSLKLKQWNRIASILDGKIELIESNIQHLKFDPKKQLAHKKYLNDLTAITIDIADQLTDIPSYEIEEEE
jgi:hypothetical protein